LNKKNETNLSGGKASQEREEEPTKTGKKKRREKGNLTMKSRKEIVYGGKGEGRKVLVNKEAVAGRNRGATRSLPHQGC